MLYHEAADLLSGGGGGNLKSIFKKEKLKSPAAQIYALCVETCKWSPVLKEVVEGSEILRHELKLTPVLSLLLVHDLLLARSGIALPSSHGLRACVERRKARLSAEFTRARIRRKCASLAALRAHVTSSFRPDQGPTVRWVRVNALKTTVEEQLATTFAGFERVGGVADVLRAHEEGEKKVVCVDEHVPLLLGVPRTVDVTRTPAYKNAEIVLQEKASCFPAVLLDAGPDDVVVDACAAPGNKTTHVAAIMHQKLQIATATATTTASVSSSAKSRGGDPKVLAFEKDKSRASTLAKRVVEAGAGDVVTVRAGVDFLKADPREFARVTALLLDPSCSGSGILNRDFIPELHLPSKPSLAIATSKLKSKKRKDDKLQPPPQTQPQQPQQPQPPSGDETARIAALASFQLSILTHAFSFPSARRVTYSTCSVHDAENEHVALAALASDAGRARGWRALRRDEQAEGMRRWDVRGRVGACAGDEGLAEACVRSFPGDKRGTMGFFVVGFVREGE